VGSDPEKSEAGKSAVCTVCVVTCVVVSAPREDLHCKCSLYSSRYSSSSLQIPAIGSDRVKYRLHYHAVLYSKRRS